ncbi:helix-turn-helix domain-containing protein, partial [Ralstonia solanacearum]
GGGFSPPPAEALGIPKPPASAAVSRLEASLGVRLLTR